MPTGSAALVVILVTLGLKFLPAGMLSVSAVLIGIIVGYFYALAVIMGAGRTSDKLGTRAASFACRQPLQVRRSSSRPLPSSASA